MVPNQFLNFLDLCGPSNSHHRGLKLLPWDRQRLMLKCIILSTRCQNFSSIGPIGQKFDVFAKTAIKTAALRPLKDGYETIFGRICITIPIGKVGQF